MAAQSLSPLLVLGAAGMLGQAVMAEAAKRGLDAAGPSHAELDMTDDAALAACFAKLKPNLVINAAAIADVGACEADPLTAWRVNARAVAVLADLCRSSGARLVQVSTEHYFAGDGDGRHAEDAPVTLLNDYARTKFAGEAFALTCPKALVARVNIVGIRGRGNPSFAEWALDVIAHDREAVLYEDAFVSCIDVWTCARALFDLAEKDASGILNLASREVFSKKAFVESLAAQLGRPLTKTRTGSVRSGSGARRADSQGLDVSVAEGLLGYRLPTLTDVTARLAAESRGRA